jgi:hypothetical protein
MFRSGLTVTGLSRVYSISLCFIALVAPAYKLVTSEKINLHYQSDSLWLVWLLISAFPHIDDPPHRTKSLLVQLPNPDNLVITRESQEIGHKWIQNVKHVIFQP